MHNLWAWLGRQSRETTVEQVIGNADVFAGCATDNDDKEGIITANSNIVLWKYGQEKNGLPRDSLCVTIYAVMMTDKLQNFFT